MNTIVLFRREGIVNVQGCLFYKYILSIFFLKELFIFCQCYFHFPFKRLWKNSLRNSPQWLSLPVHWPEQWELQTSLQWPAHAQTSIGNCQIHRAPASLQTSRVPQVEQQCTWELRQSFCLGFPPWAHFPAAAALPFPPLPLHSDGNPGQHLTDPSLGVTWYTMLLLNSMESW